MSEINPYAPPTADLSPGATAHGDGEGAFRDGDRLMVFRGGSVLPDRCVVCNGPAGGYKLRKTFYWHPPAVYLTIFIGALIYVIVAAITRKRVDIALGLCEAHRVRRRNGLILGWSGFIGSFVLLFVAVANNGLEVLIPISILTMVALPIAAAFLARVAYPTKIDDHHAWLKVGQPFLDSMPPR